MRPPRGGRTAPSGTRGAVDEQGQPTLEARLGLAVAERGGDLRLVQCGDMAGSHISLPADVPRSSGLEILDSGNASVPPVDRVTAALRDTLHLPPRGELAVAVERVAEVRGRDQRATRPVLIPCGRFPAQGCPPAPRIHGGAR